MLIKDLINEYGLGDIAALVDDAEAKIRTIRSASVSIYEYLNQVGIRFRLYDNDPTVCTVFYGLKVVGGEARSATEHRFRKKILAAAITKNPSSRPGSGQSSLTYDHARDLLKSAPIGPRGIQILTNPDSWSMVGIEYGDTKWHKKT